MESPQQLNLHIDLYKDSYLTLISGLHHWPFKSTVHISITSGGCNRRVNVQQLIGLAPFLLEHQMNVLPVRQENKRRGEEQSLSCYRQQRQSQLRIENLRHSQKYLMSIYIYIYIDRNSSKFYQLERRKKCCFIYQIFVRRNKRQNIKSLI